MLCGDLSAAGLYMEKGLAMYKYDDSFIELDQSLKKLVESHYGKSLEDLDEDERTARDWPSASLVRREVYPWSEYEPDRFAEVDEINEMMHDVAPKFEVKAVELPALTGTSVTGISKQLGVFAKEDVGPGELVLDETSLLTVNNRLQDMLCDACSSDIPDLKSANRDSVAACAACEVVFCSQECYDAAMENYHPAVCETDAESILKDPEAKEKTIALTVDDHVKWHFEYLENGNGGRDGEVCFTKTLKGWEKRHGSWELDVKATQEKLQKLPKDALKQALGDKYDMLIALNPVRIDRSTAQAPDEVQPPSRPKRPHAKDANNTAPVRDSKRARRDEEQAEGREM